MVKVTLVNMPFSDLNRPSIALTQLRSAVRERLGDRARVRVLYFNHRFAHFLGTELYAAMNTSQATNSGLGDWFFRQLAFPAEPDNTESYFQRYFPQRDAARERRKQEVLAKRKGLERFFRGLVSRYELDQEDVVGFTTMFSQTVASLAMARTIKTVNPRVTTVIGGANCEAPMGRRLAQALPTLDYVFSGPGLVSFPRFVELLAAGERESCADLRGVFSRETAASAGASGDPRDHHSVGEELPISHAVALDYDDFFASLDEHFHPGEIEPHLTFETSRGCWWGERSHCTFCGLNGSTMAFRTMPPPLALDLIRGLLDRYGDRCTHFESVDNIMPREYLKEVFPQLEPPPGTSFFYEVKADLKEHEMKLLSEAGVTEIQPGIESLATSTLKLMGKGTTSFQNVNFLKHCVEYAIRPVWNLLIGFPAEEESVYEKYLADMPLLAHLPPPSGAFPVRFDRYSPYFTRAESYGLDLSPYDFYRFIYPLDDAALHDIAYYFEDRNYQARYISGVVAWQSRLQQQVERWHARWYGGGERPQLLRTEGDERRIFDSRGEVAVEHEIDGLESRILELTHERGRGARDLALELGAAELGCEPEALASPLARLCALGLLFAEGERYISLVTDPTEESSSARFSPAALLAGVTGASSTVTIAGTK